MSTRRTSRRSFIGATGVALSAPLSGLGVAVAGAASASHVSPGDVGAIRALLHEQALHPDSSALDGICRVMPDGFDARERIDVAADGRTATAALPCIVEAETRIGPDCPLVDMARQQGGGVLTRRERGVFEANCVKRDGAWQVERVAFRPHPAEPAGSRTR